MYSTVYMEKIGAPLGPCAMGRERPAAMFERSRFSKHGGYDIDMSNQIEDSFLKRVEARVLIRCKWVFRKSLWDACNGSWVCVGGGQGHGWRTR
jgi:hypothetical protein